MFPKGLGRIPPGRARRRAGAGRHWEEGWRLAGRTDGRGGGWRAATRAAAGGFVPEKGGAAQWASQHAGSDMSSRAAAGGDSRLNFKAHPRFSSPRHDSEHCPPHARARSFSGGQASGDAEDRELTASRASVGRHRCTIIATTSRGTETRPVWVHVWVHIPVDPTSRTLPRSRNYRPWILALAEGGALLGPHMNSSTCSAGGGVDALAAPAASQRWPGISCLCTPHLCVRPSREMLQRAALPPSCQLPAARCHGISRTAHRRLLPPVPLSTALPNVSRACSPKPAIHHRIHRPA
ncbi:hypothetical protein B0J12DRAFT_750651 [Macrophomina phaseolina]|uniref:Uncharacterized protein n=1 Tax=Macrophomina phaseolina TaxID=35725 RepID=A0ABQ8GDZ5_9PEZI|nr:hypothetical protein B0J12DRAFT_750651 [Macrophomina phaseolina]